MSDATTTMKEKVPKSPLRKLLSNKKKHKQKQDQDESQDQGNATPTDIIDILIDDDVSGENNYLPPSLQVSDLYINQRSQKKKLNPPSLPMPKVDFGSSSDESTDDEEERTMAMPEVDMVKIFVDNAEKENNSDAESEPLVETKEEILPEIDPLDPPPTDDTEEEQDQDSDKLIPLTSKSSGEKPIEKGNDENDPDGDTDTESFTEACGDSDDVPNENVTSSVSSTITTSTSTSINAKTTDEDTSLEQESPKGTPDTVILQQSDHENKDPVQEVDDDAIDDILQENFGSEVETGQGPTTPTTPQSSNLSASMPTTAQLQAPQILCTSASDTASSDGDIEGRKIPSRGAKPKRGILRSRSRSLDRANNNAANVDANLTVERNEALPPPIRKAVSFADENGGIISEQQTIDVSPSKLSRRVRRGSNSTRSIGTEHEEELVQKGVMGRVLVLLMDPPTKQYELTSVPFPLVNNDNGVVGPTQLMVLLGLVGKSASFEPLREKNYIALMRPDDTEEMDSHLTILDHKIIKDEVLIAIPEGYTPDSCSKFADPILKDKRLTKLLKKLKKHEKKAEKRRRLRGRGMKPNRSGTPSNSSKSMPSDDAVHTQSRALDVNFDDSSDLIAEINDEETSNWSNLLFTAVVMAILISLMAGSASIIEQNKRNDVIQNKVVQEGDKVCGRGMFCKPFGIKSEENGERMFMKKLKDGIRKWKIEGDDLML